MDEGFEDIDIIDLDVSKTSWSRVHTSMRTLYLKLSREPDTEWVRFFFEERASRIALKRHGVWIEDGFIVFDCLLRDVDPHHLPDLHQSLTYANARSREMRAAQREAGEQNRAEAQIEQQALRDLRAHIRGERGTPVPTDDAPAAALATSESDLDVRRNEWRLRFRKALASQLKEPRHGND